MKFHISGMHCNACVILTESIVSELPNVKTAKSDLADHSLELTGDFGTKSLAEVALEVNKALSPHGYVVSIEKTGHARKWSEFKIALPVAAIFALVFIILQKIGVVNWVNASEISYGTAFLIGVIASLSSCMAVVGGLVLSMSATFAKEGDKVRPQVLFHVGRMVTFLVLGGVIGAIGSAFTLNAIATFILGVLIGVVMFIMGLNLLDVFPWAKKLVPSMPKHFGRKTMGLVKLNHTLTPALVGAATFFLPCGFTQSMQLYTLTTGSFMGGALTMFAFALGTLPVLALISFSSFSIRNTAKSGIFFKTAGLVVIMFAILNIVNSLAVMGIIPPLFNF